MKGKLRHTAVIMNMCVFGAVALGPFIGGAQAEAHAWRPLFWIVAAIALLALVMAALTFDDAPPADLDAPRDLLGHRAGGGRLRRRLHRRRATDQPRIHRCGGDRAAVRWPGVDRGADRLPVQGASSAADDPHDVDQLDPGRRRRRRAVRRGRVGGGDRIDRQRVVADLQPGPRRAAVPARTRRRRRDGVRVRDRHHPARDALPSAGRHGVARGRDRGVPDRPSRQPATRPARRGADRDLRSAPPSHPRCSSRASHCSRPACSASSRSSSSCGRWPRSWSRRSSPTSR